jgi:ABC-type lipoprotein export system ATPase subunit
MFFLELADRDLMAKVNFEETFEIYLFTKQEKENNFSKLSEFLSFLKFNRLSLPYKFSYVSRGDGLIPELSLNENILMDFSPNSLTASKEFQFQEFLKEEGNRPLEDLYQKIFLPHELPRNSDAQMRKVSALIKSLIFEGQFIFLEEPEIDLDEESIALFIAALKDRIEKHKQNIFIFSHNVNLWGPHAHQLVRREKNFSFATENISKTYQWKKERDQFFHPHHPHKLSENKASQLSIHMPKSKSISKASKSIIKKSA